MNNIIPPSNSKALKTRFTIKFIQAMRRLNKSRAVGRDRYKRYRAVRALARTSMAAAVGPERAWSRAVLRSHRLRRGFQMISRKRRRQFARGNPREKLGFGIGEEEEDDLRGLVPGGQEMGFCSLLSETAHYIKCLQTQVQVMTDILHSCSS